MGLDLSDFIIVNPIARRRKRQRKVFTPETGQTIVVHPDSSWRLDQASILQHKSKVYLVAKPAHEALAAVLRPTTLIAAASNDGTPFIWPARDRSALAAADQSKGMWVKVYWKSEDRSYRVEAADAPDIDPKWPASFMELLMASFDDRVIQRPDEPIVAEILAATRAKS